MVRVRFAPSPTGIPHIGNIRTALFNYLFAKHNKGEFILRIEDTDQKRFVKEAEDAIFESLDWLGLKHDGEVIHQSERLSIYKEHTKILLDKKVAYEKDNAIWILMPKQGSFEWKDLIGNKEISFKGETQEDFVILKSDGFPTYHLANVIDDHLMEITHVIRGEEWISSVPKHLYLYQSFGWKAPMFAHLPIILGVDKTKLSKRHGAKSVLDYRNEGYLKEAVINFMAFLGWNPGGEEEIFTLEEIINKFDIKDVNISNPIFDTQKLNWMNSVHIRRLSDNELERRIMEHLPELKKIPNKDLENFIILSKSRIKTLNEFKDLILPFFAEIKIDLTNQEKEVGQELIDALLKIKEWKIEGILNTLKNITAKNGLKMNFVYKITTGSEFGPPLPEVFSTLGKEKILGILRKNIK